MSATVEDAKAARAWRDAIEDHGAIPLGTRLVGHRFARFWGATDEAPKVHVYEAYLADLLDVSQDTVKRALDKLCRAGVMWVVERARGTRAPRYLLVHPYHWPRASGASGCNSAPTTNDGTGASGCKNTLVVGAKIATNIEIQEGSAARSAGAPRSAQPIESPAVVGIQKPRRPRHAWTRDGDRSEFKLEGSEEQAEEFAAWYRSEDRPAGSRIRGPSGGVVEIVLHRGDDAGEWYTRARQWAVTWTPKAA
jgi:hypothetical protein